ncbi:MAG: hypothetical protein ABH846_03495 [Patescibacteria group bacterium]
MILIPIDISISTALGVLIAFILAIPAIFLETSRRVKNLPLLIDVKVWFGRKLTHGEIFLVDLLLHLIIGAFYGFFYALFASQGWLFITNAPYTIHSMIIFAVLFWVGRNVIMMPLVGFGIFGLKEGKTVWYETLAVLLMEGTILWLIIQFYQPYFFYSL